MLRFAHRYVERTTATNWSANYANLAGACVRAPLSCTRLPKRGLSARQGCEDDEIPAIQGLARSVQRRAS